MVDYRYAPKKNTNLLGLVLYRTLSEFKTLTGLLEKKESYCFKKKTPAFRLVLYV